MTGGIQRFRVRRTAAIWQMRCLASARESRRAADVASIKAKQVPSFRPAPIRRLSLAQISSLLPLLTGRVELLPREDDDLRTTRLLTPAAKHVAGFEHL
jgi:hypothetical protein